jgi:hypothetical protein
MGMLRTHASDTRLELEAWRQCQDRNVTKPWMLDELVYAGPEHLDPSFVAVFDRKQGYPDPAGDLAVLREHGIGPAAALVDLGAGTGSSPLPPLHTPAGWWRSTSRPLCWPCCNNAPPRPGCRISNASRPGF